MDVAIRGRKRRLVVEDEYWQLMLAGVGTVEACRRVGIGRKTGHRWRAERGDLAPAQLREGDRYGRYLSLSERERIAVLRRGGISIREIGLRLGRSASTISRETRRNVSRHDRGGYDAALAHSRARERARRERVGRLRQDSALRALVQAKLELEWSPEQISAWLRVAYPGNASWHLCHETIYQGVYWPGGSGLSRTLTRKLRTRRPLRRGRRRPEARTPRFIAPATLIDMRPAIVEERSRLGDLEGDLIVGRSSRSAIGTIVDRKSGFVVLLHLPDDHTAASLNAAITRQLDALPEGLRRTLTWDQGSEMARHDQVASLFADGVYFAHPGKPWQRGTNENTNGLLRQYFPKGTDLSIHTAQNLQNVADRLNDRPRKRHSWASPAEFVRAALTLDR